MRWRRPTFPRNPNQPPIDLPRGRLGYDPQTQREDSHALTNRRSERAAAIAAMHDAVDPEKTRAAFSGAGHARPRSAYCSQTTGA